LLGIRAVLLATLLGMHRDAGLIFVGLLLALVLGALLMNVSHKEGSVPVENAPAAVSFTLLTEGDVAAEITERVNYRIRTESEFAGLWAALHEDDDMPLPVVDFEAHDVLAVFEGMRPSGGYDISVRSVERTPAGELRVTILHEEPGATCMATSIITSPFELVVVPKSEAKIVREDLTEIKECE